MFRAELEERANRHTRVAGVAWGHGWVMMRCYDTSQSYDELILEHGIKAFLFSAARGEVCVISFESHVYNQGRHVLYPKYCAFILFLQVCGQQYEMWQP
jgi:hypothetical protein